MISKSPSPEDFPNPPPHSEMMPPPDWGVCRGVLLVRRSSFQLPERKERDASGETKDAACPRDPEIQI